MISFDRAITNDLEAASRREWLETNGLGGWASSSVGGAHTRRYHGLLVAACRPPTSRRVLVSKLEESLVIGGKRYELGCNYYPGAVHPAGYRYLQGFSKELFPCFEYRAGDVVIRKTIVAVSSENTTLILFEIQGRPGPFVLELRPFVAARDYHNLVRANDAIKREASFDKDIFRVRPYEGTEEIFISIPTAKYYPWPEWYYNFEYPAERERGLDFREDLFTHGIFKLRLDSVERIGIIVSTQDPAGRDAFKLLAREEKRRRDLLRGVPRQDEGLTALTLASDQFIVQRGKQGRSIVAGYHWFADWGRDAMIALPGIALVTKRYSDANLILRTFARTVSQGQVPNRFLDEGKGADYNSVDATLWFFVAVYQYYRATKDTDFARDMIPVMEEIVQWHARGTRYGIRVDEDGLLSAGEAGMQLTWMDAKVGDAVVTPRQGRAVEINALWYNAVCIMAGFMEIVARNEEAMKYRHMAGTIRKRFREVFWNGREQCLYDRIDGDLRDASIRPNQIFALSLPFPLLSGKKAECVLRVIEEKLFTPFGLRSLDPNHPDYRPSYAGNQESRDRSYHQGTVWPWLLGPFIDAVVRIRGAKGKAQAKAIIKTMLNHLSAGGVGSISEIFDGDPPHAPRGCIAQAWSVGEILRSYAENMA